LRRPHDSSSKENQIMKKTAILLALLALPLLQQQAQAANAPILALSRLSIGAGAQLAWTGAAQEQEPQVGLYGAYNLTPHVSLSGGGVYSFKSEKVEPILGVRVLLWKGAAPVAKAN